MLTDLILFLAANPSGTTQLCLAEECAAIERELCTATDRRLTFQSRWAVTIDELMRHLDVLQPTVIHFGGHGAGGGELGRDPMGSARDVAGATERARSAGIYLQDDRGAPQLITADALTAMIGSTASSARVVVLNACYSDAHAEALCRIVDCVVGMDGPIGDEAARVFSMSFYRALAHQRSVGNALAQARATLDAKRLAGHHLPRCHTRRGADPGRIVLGGHGSRSESWARRLEAILRLAQAACTRLRCDPVSAAVRARQAVEHIVDYLYERELAAGDRSQPLDARFECVDAKLAITPLVASHIRSVLAQTSLAIECAGNAIDPAPGLLTPCLGSLAIAVEWFFHDYLNRPDVHLEWPPIEPELGACSPVPDAIPSSTTTPTIVDATSIATEVGRFIPIWRTSPAASLLRIAPADGAGQEQQVFRIEDPTSTYRIGRTDQRSDGTRNDFALPMSWTSVSRDQGWVAIRDQGILLTNTSSKSSVFVRGEPVPAGTARLVCHGDIVQLGRCVGMFVDGRYYAAAPAAAVDRRTGLLSRLGLIAEISSALAIAEDRILFVVRCPDHAPASAPGGPAEPEQLAATVALAIHRQAPSRPVARIGVHVAALLISEHEVREAATVAQGVTGTRGVCGFATLVGTAEQATQQLESCLGAVNRIAIAGSQTAEPEDLVRHALVPGSTAELAACARAPCDPELAAAPIAGPGTHRYHAAHDAREVEQTVTSKQLGRWAREEGMDDAATG